MDLLPELFRKLNEEFAQKAPTGQLLLTIKQIEACLVASAPHPLREEIVQELPLPAYQQVSLPIVDPVKKREVEVPKVDFHKTLPVENPYSINDHLKKEVLELGDLLNEAPIRDLKKGIGLNDRYVFIAELFGGDEGFYEKCIKTINAFSILQEAEYWVKRELALKLGWKEKDPAVRHFFHLIKRRFS